MSTALCAHEQRYNRIESPVYIRYCILKIIIKNVKYKR